MNFEGELREEEALFPCGNVNGVRGEGFCE